MSLCISRKEEGKTMSIFLPSSANGLPHVTQYIFRGQSVVHVVRRGSASEDLKTFAGHEQTH